MMRRIVYTMTLLALSSLLKVDAQVTSYGQYADTLVTAANGSYVWAWIHLPGDFFLRPDKKYPIIFFFHGAGQAGRGEVGLDSLIATTWNGTAGAGPAWLINQGDSMNFYNYVTGDTDRPIVVSPQFPGWSAFGPNVDWMITDMLYGKPRFAGRIDSNRISVTGLSAGGQGAYDEISGYDNNCSCFFGPVHKVASAVIMSAALNTTNGEISAYTTIINNNTYLWGMGDSLNDGHGKATAQVIDSILAYHAGSADYLIPTFYQFPGAPGHCCWLAEYQPSFTQTIDGHALNVYQFMLSHSRAGLAPTPPVSDLHPAGYLLKKRAHTIP